MYIVQSPLKVPVTKKKYFILNINNYRNTHFQVLNKAKRTYKEMIKTQIDWMPKYAKCSATFIVYPKTKRLFDIANVCAIHEKFFCDSMVELGKLEDDNYEFWVESTYKFGNIDKENPRVDIIVKGEVI